MSPGASVEKTDPQTAVVCDAGPLIHLVMLTDDAAARLAAEALLLRVHGTIGVLLRSVRLGRRTRDQVVGTLESLGERSSLHIRPALIDEVNSTLRYSR